MIFLFLYMCVFIFLISSVYTTYTRHTLLVGFVSIFIIHIILLELRKDRVQYIQHGTIHDIYHNIQNGDVIFASSTHITTVLEHFLASENHGTQHAVVVMEENGEKYVIHAHPSSNKGADYVIDEDHFFGRLGGPVMRLYKEPLIIFLLSYAVNMTFQVFRTNQPVVLPENFSLDRSERMYYCTLAIGPLLVHNNIIRKDNTLLFPYRPDYIAKELVEKNVPCFYVTMNMEL